MCITVCELLHTRSPYCIEEELQVILTHFVGQDVLKYSSNNQIRIQALQAVNCHQQPDDAHVSATKRFNLIKTRDSVGLSG